MLEQEGAGDRNYDHNAGCNGQRKPVAFAGFDARNEFDFGTCFHERILHPLLKESLAVCRYVNQHRNSAMIAEVEKQKHRGLVLLHLLSDFQSCMEVGISR
jgi:hypothetical protein